MEEVNVSSEDHTIIHRQVIRVQLNYVTVIRVVVVMSSSLFFIYVNCVMLFTLKSKPNFIETPRYILFANMLFADSVQMMSSAVLYSVALAEIRVVKAVCALVVLVSAVTFSNTPLNLAMMSLERYVAICFPLRHTKIATPRRTHIAIGGVWLLSSLNFTIDMFYIIMTVPHSLATPIFCRRQWLIIAKWQIKLAQMFNGLYFVAVAVTIIYTYIGIMVAARSISSDKDSASKAHRTVLLHLIQLGLCLTSFLYSIIGRVILTVNSESLFFHLQFLNFFSLIIFPRCLSPLIYGLRDKAFRPLFLNYFRCKRNKSSQVKPVMITH